MSGLEIQKIWSFEQQKETKRTKIERGPHFVPFVTFCSRFLCLLLCLLALPTFAATNDLTTLLQRGLFEEEANRNLDAAITSYESLAKQFDKDRQIAATAVFRLGECYRKLGKTNEAVVQYERILRDFSDQQTLATLSRQNISAIAPAAVSSQDAVRSSSAAYEYVIQTGDTMSSIVAAIRKSGTDISVDGLLRMNPTLNPTRLRVGQKILVPTGALGGAARGTADGDVAGEAKALAAKLNGLERFKDDPEKHAKAVLSLFPDDWLRKMLNNLPLLKEQEAQFAQGRGTTNSFRVAIGDYPLDLLDLSIGSSSKPSQPEAAAETRRQLALISDRVDKILSEQRLRLDVLQTVAGSSPAATKSVEPPVLDDEEKEIRRIQAMIQNSPDLINAPSGEDKLTPLARAASQGYLRVVEFLLKNGAEIDQKSGSSSRTALHHAVYNGHRKMAELLISRGADVNALASGNVTPLYMAVERRFQSLVELLLASKADPNVAAGQFTGRLDETPLMQAVRNGSESIVSTLLSHGADPNRLNRLGNTGYPVEAKDRRGDYGSALHMAAARIYPRITALLLTNGSSVKLLDVNGETPLHVAVANNATNNALQLIRAGADVNSTGVERKTGGATPLVLASYGRVEAMRLLLENGANPNVTVLAGNSGMTPLMIAAGTANEEIVSLLLKAGAKPNLEDSGGLTALIRAVEGKSPEIVRILLRNGANPNTRRGGWPVLTLAVTDYADSGVVAELIRAKADVNAFDADGGTSLHRAVMMKRKESVEQLLAAGANPNLRNREGKTPLELLQPSPLPALGILTIVNSASSSESAPSDLAALLRQHGALDDLPDFSVIKVKWLGQERGVGACWAHTNGWNRFTLMEALARVTGSDYPDYSRVIVHRPAGSGRAQPMEIKVNLLNNTNGIDCSKDIGLEFGDTVEIPERDHSLSEEPRVFRDQQRRQIEMCLLRHVRLTVRGEARELTVGWDATLSSALSQPAAKSLLLASSDLSRVKVTRRLPSQQQPIQIVVNVAAKPLFHQDFWLRDGDVIEVPEK